MKNSQKAQESLARGFIPNFAPALGGGGIGSLKGLFDDAQIAPALKKVKDNAFQASISLSVLSGVVDTFNKDGESKLGSVVSTATQAASTFASIATVIPGPVGLIAGAAVGLYQAFDGISQIMRDQTGPIKKALEKTKEETSKLNDASQTYATTFEKLQESYKEPKGTPEEAAKTQIKYQNDLAKALADLPSAYRDQIAAAKDLTEVQTAIAEAQRQQLAQQKQGEFGLGVAEAIKTGKKIDPEKLIKDAFKASTPEQQQAFTENFKQGNVSGMGRFMGSTVVGTDAGPKQLESALKELGLSEKNVALVMQEGEGQTRALFDALREMGVELEKNSDQANELAKRNADVQKANAKAAEDARKEAEIKKANAIATEIAADATRKATVFQMKLANIRKSNQSRITSEAARSQLGTMQPFRGEATMAKTAAAIEESKRVQENQLENQNLQLSAIGELGDNLANTFQSEIEKLRSEGKDTTPLSAKKGEIAGLIQQGGTPEEVAARLKEFADKSGLNQADLIGLQSKQLEVLQKTNQDIQINNEGVNTQNQISRDQLKAQLQQIKDQQLLKGAGGIQGFLDPETLKDPLEKFTKGLEGMSVGKKFGLGATEARGGLQAGIALQEMTGGFGSDKLNKSLKDLVVPQMAEQKRAIFEGMAAQAEAAGNTDLAQIARDAASQAEEMAQKQFDNQFKLEDNVAGIYKLLQGELGGGKQGSQTQDAVQKGIENADKTTAATTSPALASTIAPAAKTGTYASDLTANSYKEKPMSEWTAADYKAREKASDEAWNKNMEKSMGSLGGTPATVQAGNLGEGIGRGKINQLPPPLKQTTGLTGAGVQNYLGANESQQQTLMSQRKALEGKTDAESNRKRTLLDNQINTLRTRNAGAQEIQGKVGMQENPVKEVQRQQQKGMPTQEKLTQAVQENTQVQKEQSKKQETSKGEMNVSFTPLSVEVKGSIETASDELSKKMMDAVKKAVEEISPGILAKLYGPAREAKKA
ncbi:MAG: hypothetical protein EBR82_12490 [Caulobacteraceae bacterium]|nr:hypothetical protein [Caulobacteraceae bacterium]